MSYNMETLAKTAFKLRKEFGKLYIYGAGIYANNIYKYLTKQEIQVDGFIVTRKDNQEETTLPIYEVKEILSKNVGIILGMNSHNSRQVIDYLKELGVEENSYIDGGLYLENGAERLGFEGDAIMEITSRIGCKINCKYCPQDNLLKKYYDDNRDRASVMSMETFQICLEKIPMHVGIVFSGFAEPFLNADFIDMIKLACSQGRNVDLFTTLVGANMEMVKEISKLPLHYVGLHCADVKGYAKIPTSQEYYEMVEYLLSCKKVDRDAPFVDFCNAQTEPDKKIQEICKDRYEIGTTLFDRAGNLQAEHLISKSKLKGSLECSMCGSLVNRNVLLPDGSVVICCMDYSLKHIIGNLLNESYEEIQNGKEASRIRRGLAGDETEDILCRECSCARVVR